MTEQDQTARDTHAQQQQEIYETAKRLMEEASDPATKERLLSMMVSASAGFSQATKPSP